MEELISDFNVYKKWVLNSGILKTSNFYELIIDYPAFVKHNANEKEKTLNLIKEYERQIEEISEENRKLMQKYWNPIQTKTSINRVKPLIKLFGPVAKDRRATVFRSMESIDNIIKRNCVNQKFLLQVKQLKIINKGIKNYSELTESCRFTHPECRISLSNVEQMSDLSSHVSWLKSAKTSNKLQKTIEEASKRKSETTTSHGQLLEMLTIFETENTRVDEYNASYNSLDKLREETVQMIDVKYKEMGRLCKEFRQNIECYYKKDYSTDGIVPYLGVWNSDFLQQVQDELKSLSGENEGNKKIGNTCITVSETNDQEFRKRCLIEFMNGVVPEEKIEIRDEVKDLEFEESNENKLPESVENKLKKELGVLASEVHTILESFDEEFDEVISLRHSVFKGQNLGMIMFNLMRKRICYKVELNLKLEEALLRLKREVMVLHRNNMSLKNMSHELELLAEQESSYKKKIAFLESKGKVLLQEYNLSRYISYREIKLFLREDNENLLTLLENIPSNDSIPPFRDALKNLRSERSSQTALLKQVQKSMSNIRSAMEKKHDESKTGFSILKNILSEYLTNYALLVDTAFDSYNVHQVLSRNNWLHGNRKYIAYEEEISDRLSVLAHKKIFEDIKPILSKNALPVNSKLARLKRIAKLHTENLRTVNYLKFECYNLREEYVDFCMWKNSKDLRDGLNKRTPESTLVTAMPKYRVGKSSKWEGRILSLGKRLKDILKENKKKKKILQVLLQEESTLQKFIENNFGDKSERDILEMKKVLKLQGKRLEEMRQRKFCEKN